MVLTETRAFYRLFLMINKINTTETGPKYCFSYIRFSSEGQRDGSSVVRQSEIASEIVAKTGWILRQEWNIRQEAVSAYKKHNFPKLMAIIDAAKSGIIPQGTVCIIECIDRLTRATLDQGREMLRQMLLSGIEICDNEGNHFVKEDLNDLIKLLNMCAKIAAANEYSERLSKRVRKAYQERISSMQNGVILLKTKEHANRKDMPAWITNTGKGYELNSKAKIIASMFKEYLNKVGPASIARKFNKTNVETLSGKAGVWSQSIIYRLLSDRRTLGEIKIKGEAIKGYYPSVIEENIFLRVQSRLLANKGKPCVGKMEKPIVNLFSGVAFCTCGEKIKVTSGNAGKYITCWNKVNGRGCTTPMVQYAPFEKSFMEIFKLKAKELIPSDTGETGNVELQILRGKLAENEKQIANITEALTIAFTKALVLKQASLEQQSEEIIQNIAIESAKSVAASGGLERYVAIQNKLNSGEIDNAFRITLQSWVRENVDKITVDTSKKEFNVDLKTGCSVEMDFKGRYIGLRQIVSLITEYRDNEISI